MKNAFPQIPKIQYEGPRSKNPLAFKHYQAGEIVEGRTMREHLRFAVVYWHTFRGTGSDPFGMGTMQRPWDDGTSSVRNAQNRARVAFEFIEKLGAHTGPPPSTPLPVQSTDFEELLLSVVAERTGYPVTMLNTDMELESDLGVDSIKRVEILSAVRERAGDLPDGNVTELLKLRSLREIIDANVLA